jgi:hypothetical protein
MLRSGSPWIGIFSSMVVVLILLLLAYEFRTPGSGTPEGTDAAAVRAVPKTK